MIKDEKGLEHSVLQRLVMFAIRVICDSCECVHNLSLAANILVSNLHWACGMHRKYINTSLDSLHRIGIANMAIVAALRYVVCKS